MPLIRYDLGDIAKITRQSICQPGALSFVRIHGRERMMFRLPAGGTVLPALDAKIMLQLGIKRFRLVQTALDAIELQYIGQRPDWQLDQTAIENIVAEELSPAFKVVTKEVNEFPLAPSGKYLMHERLIP